ncbi:PAS domain-containing protein [uncultured Maricaulis sp.]|uniref:PAS domain-containing protein n=1 Tax=uncultured Maricaulis sp. TaxID=174710 RepID=UPI0025E3DD26|nr:PAS domain-containing protein [uncultured Maricaulis sp.]
MSRSPAPTLTGVERTFHAGEVIVTKTDLKGRITYANDIFQRASAVTERQALGQPHNFIRHPDMPRSVFKLMWDTISAGQELFAYVVNRAMNGDHYWVYAHVTPSFNDAGEIIGYHSNRREPDRQILERDIIPFYAQLRDVETAAASPKQALAAGSEAIAACLAKHNVEYDEFICTLGQGQRRDYR